jgi:hypothetical protein
LSPGSDRIGRPVSPPNQRKEQGTDKNQKSGTRQ